MLKRALISVSNKTGIVDFAKVLVELGIEIISTGGTGLVLHEAGIPYRTVEEITGLPEMLDGRVKTLHPRIHGGILGKRDVHAAEAIKHQINWIDLVVVNFYPFADVVTDKEMPWDKVVEYIDIGGPTMVRAAAKNFAWVSVIVDPADYSSVLTALKTKQAIDFSMRQYLAEKAFALTSQYDAMIHAFFLKKNQMQSPYPQQWHLQLDKFSELRYGENPHQKACAYTIKSVENGLLAAHQHQGKSLSYNNLLDTEAAWQCVSEFTEPTCVIVKHANPCGVATAATIDAAFARAYQADSASAFGGIVALNRPCTKTMAESMVSIFMEVILAPAYSKEALAVFVTKPNLRLLELPAQSPQLSWEMKYITGGMLVQERDTQILQTANLTVMTRVQPTTEDLSAMLFAWRVVKHIKSNAILLVKDQTTVGIGAGQVSRIDAVDLAIRKAGSHVSGTVLASDAFFPFRDSIDRLANTGVRAIVQPGGSVRDTEVIAACDEYGIAMAFTGMRCFRH